MYLVATVAMAFTAASYVMMSREVPSAGSVFAYARAGIGRRTGFLTGWMVMLDYLLIPSVAYLFTGIALNSLAPGVPVWAWTAGAVVVTTALNLAGSKVAARAAAAVVVAEVVVLLVVLVVGVFVLATDGLQRPWSSPIGLDVLVSFVDVGALVAFVMLHASVIGYFWVSRRGESRSVTRHVAAPVLGASILVAILVNASTLALVVGAVWLVAGLVVGLVRRDPVLPEAL